MFRLLLVVPGACAVWGAGASGQEVSAAEQAALARRLAPALVRVQYMPRYDRGEAPDGDGRVRTFAAASAWERATEPHAHLSESWAVLVDQERPAERGGFLIGPVRVYAPDPMLHPRFLRSIAVRLGDDAVGARPAAYGLSDEGWILELERPLRGGVPLQFDPARPGPYLIVEYRQRGGVWSTRVTPMSESVLVAEIGGPCRVVPAPALILDRAGMAVALTGSGLLPLDDSWKTSPDAWPLVTEAEMARMLASLADACNAHLPRVQVRLRSPRLGSEGEGWMRALIPQPQVSELTTEWNGIGLLIDARRVLVLANFPPRVTARVERITIHWPDGSSAPATFAGSLRDWGAFVATLDHSRPGAVSLSRSDLLALRHRLLLCAEVSVQGDTRIVHCGRVRIGAFWTGFRGQRYPQVLPGPRRGPDSDDPGGFTAVSFVYEPDASLVAVPLSRRLPVAVRNDYSPDATFDLPGRQVLAVPVGVLEAALHDEAGIDPHNRPLSEDEEHRLAWLGVELQPMTPDLARASRCVEQTAGGTSGAVIAYVYENSPAARAGLRLGDVLLRLHMAGQPRPLEVRLDEAQDWFPGDLWELLEHVPEEYLDRLPPPWGDAENALTRALTEAGFGTRFEAEIFRDGQVFLQPFTVEQGPPHFAAAPRVQSATAGITVRDLTYEVRRYFQLGADDPGVVISRVERGEKGAIAGLKPFELIVSVNGQPVHSAADFARAIAPGGEMRLMVRRLTSGRVVKLRLEPAGPTDVSSPASSDAQASSP